jgi:hypothetical protein
MDTLQTDSLSLPNILPSLLDVECHLEEFKSPINIIFIDDMLKAFTHRLGALLDPMNEKFNALPAVACSLDATVAAVILTPEMRDLLEAAKRCIIGFVCTRASLALLICSCYDTLYNHILSSRPM